MKLRVILAVMFLCLPGVATAQTVIASVTGGINFTTVPGFIGQSFTTTTPEAMTNITFNYFSNVPATTPAAFGTGFLLSQEYLGTPNGLSAATPGYLGQATASSGLYTFGSAVTLQPATQYFFYDNSLIPTGAVSGNASYAGGVLYFTGDTTGNSGFGIVATSANFLVQGIAVPEPATWALIGMATFGTSAYGWNRRRKAIKNRFAKAK